MRSLGAAAAARWDPLDMWTRPPFHLLDRRSDLLVTRIDALRSAVRQARLRAPFHIDAWVVLPDHMHCLWTLPEGDADFPGRWRAIKTAFSKSVPIGEPRSPVMSSRGERRI